jgi:hypothetical protein
MASSKSKVEQAFHEVYSKIPKNVKKTGKTGAAKRKMLTAVALSKARQAGAHIPSYDKGGTVQETGLALVHKGETVIPNNDGKQTRSPQEIPSVYQKSGPQGITPDSKRFHKGSEGSYLENENPRKYPEKSPSTDDVMAGNRGNEQQEQHLNSARAGLLKETDHPFESNAIIDNRIHDDSPELVRRQNNHSRDRRNGFRITDDRVYPDNA